MDGVPPALDEIVQCLLQKEPSARPESAAATAVMLRLVKAHLDKEREPLIAAPEFRTEPTPFDNTLLTTRGAPASTPSLRVNDTVPGAPPFTDVVADVTDRDAGGFGSTAPSPVDLGHPPIDRQARTRSQRDDTPILPRHGTSRLDELEALGEAASSRRAREPSTPARAANTETSETPISSAASVPARTRRRVESAPRRKVDALSLAPWVVLAFTMVGAAVALVHYGPRGRAAPTTNAAPLEASAGEAAQPPAAHAPTTESSAAASAPTPAASPVAVASSRADAGGARVATSASARPREVRPASPKRGGSSTDPASIGFE